MSLTAPNYAPRSLFISEQIVSTALQMLPLKHGKHRLLDRILPRPIGNSHSFVTTSFQGASLRTDIDDLVGWHFAMLGSFDPEVSEILITASGRNDVFWDVGANKGAVAYAVATALTDSKIIAIEPQSSMIANLTYNLMQVCPDRFELHALGLSTKEATATLTVPDDNLGRATLHGERMHAQGRTETISLITAKELVKRSRFGWPTLVKIDVEGHEREVFETLLPCLESGTCRALVFENSAAAKPAFESISALSERCGYRIFGITKTPFSTRLIPAAAQINGATDYVLASPRLIAEGAKFNSLIARTR